MNTMALLADADLGLVRPGKQRRLFGENLVGILPPWLPPFSHRILTP
jgi:hypothetical protein